MRCPNCGELNDAGARFCFNCGTRLEEPEGRRVGGSEGTEGRQQGEEERRREEAPTIAPPPAERLAAPQYGTGQPVGPTAAQPQYPDWLGAGYEGAFGAPTERKGRSKLLMITLGILLGCLILCVGIFIYSLTPSGQEFFEDIGTSAADFQTEAADD